MTSDTDDRGLGSGGILRRAWLPVLFGLLVGGLAFTAVSSRGPSYETCANLRIRSAPIDQAVLGLPAGDKAITNFIGETAGQIEQARVAKRAIRYLDGKPLNDPKDLLDNIAARPDLNTGFIGVCAKANRPRDAQRIANATSRAYVDLNREAQKANRRAARRELRAIQRRRVAALRRQAPASAAREAIANTIEASKDQISRLILAERINTDTVAVATPADLPRGAAGVPAGAIGLLGFIIGAGLLGSILAVRELTDGRLRSRRQLEHVAGAPVLAEIRHGRRLKQRGPLEDLRRRQSEPLRLLYARLCNATELQDHRTLAIASVNDDDATAGAAWYLSATAAAAGARVLLIESGADHAASDGAEPSAGLADVVAGDRRLDEVVTRISADGRHDVDVVTYGDLGARAQLRGGEAVRDLIARLRGEYDHVVISTTGVQHADAVPFVRGADGTLLVCRRTGTHRETLRDACSQLAQTGTPLLGIIAVGFVR